MFNVRLAGGHLYGKLKIKTKIKKNMRTHRNSNTESQEQKKPTSLTAIGPT